MATRKKAKRPASKASKGSVSAPVAQTAYLLNGQPVAQKTKEEIGTQSIGQVANSIAREHGLKSYSILVNGVKVGTEEAAKPLAGAVSIEVFAKETRG